MKKFDTIEKVDKEARSYKIGLVLSIMALVAFLVIASVAQSQKWDSPPAGVFWGLIGVPAGSIGWAGYVLSELSKRREELQQGTGASATARS